MEPDPSGSPTYILAVTSSSLPILSTFAFPLTASYLYLQQRTHIQNSYPATEHAPSRKETYPDDVLRAKAQFVETVPLALILAGLVELNGGSKRLLGLMMGGLCVFQALLGGVAIPAPPETRRYGFLGSQGVIFSLAGWAVWQSRGFWGL